MGSFRIIDQTESETAFCNSYDRDRSYSTSNGGDYGSRKTRSITRYVSWPTRSQADPEETQAALVEIFDIDPGLAKDALRQIPVALGDQLTMDEAKEVSKELEKTKANIRVWSGQSARQQYRLMNFSIPFREPDIEEPEA